MSFTLFAIEPSLLKMLSLDKLDQKLDRLMVVLEQLTSQVLLVKKKLESFGIYVASTMQKKLKKWD